MSAESRARALLSQCEAEFPLGQARLSEQIIRTVDIGRLTLHVVGLSAKLASGTEVLGAAAAADSFPVEGAYFELLERLAIRRATEEGAVTVRDRSGAPSCRAQLRVDDGPIRRSLSNRGSAASQLGAGLQLRAPGVGGARQRVAIVRR